MSDPPDTKRPARSNGCAGRLFLFLFLLDAVELLIDLPQVFLREVYAHHADHSRNTEDSEAAESSRKTDIFGSFRRCFAKFLHKRI